MSNAIRINAKKSGRSASTPGRCSAVLFMKKVEIWLPMMLSNAALQARATLAVPGQQQSCLSIRALHVAALRQAEAEQHQRHHAATWIPRAPSPHPVPVPRYGAAHQDIRQPHTPQSHRHRLRPANRSPQRRKPSSPLHSSRSSSNNGTFASLIYHSRSSDSPMISSPPIFTHQHICYISACNEGCRGRAEQEVFFSWCSTNISGPE